MDLRQLHLVALPAAAFAVCACGVLALVGAPLVSAILLVVLAVAAFVIPRRILRQHEQSVLSALTDLDPDGDSTEDVCDRIRRVAASGRQTLERARKQLDERKRGLEERESIHKKEKVKAGDELKAARRESERLSGWLDLTPGAMVRVDGGGLIRWMNPGGEDLLADALGKPLSRFLADWKQGRSGEFVLVSNGTETPVYAESTRADHGPAEGGFVLLRDLSADHAMHVARDAAERARAGLHEVMASIAPQATPEETLADLAGRVHGVIAAREMGLIVPGEDEAASLTVLTTPVDGGASASCEPLADGAAAAEVFADGRERIVLDLAVQADRADERALAESGVGAVGFFPLTSGDKVCGVWRIGFDSAEEVSPGTIATIHQLIPSVVRAVTGTLQFRVMKRDLMRWKWYLEHLPDPVLLCAVDGAVLFSNRAATALRENIGVPEGTIESFVAEEDRATLGKQLERGVAEGRARFEVRLAAKNEERSVEVSLTRLDLGQGERTLVLALRDISKRKAEAEEVHRREEEAEELYQLALDLGRSLDLQWVMQQIFTKALEVTKLDFGWATLIEHETGSRDLATGHQIDVENVRALYDEQGHVGFEDRVLRTKRPVVLESMDEDPTITREAAEQSGVRSLISVPLLLEGDVVGILNLASSRSYQFKIQDIENLGAFGRIFARGVSNSKRFYEARRRADNYKVMIGEQHARLKTLAEDVSAIQRKVQTYRDLLDALWARGGAIETLIAHGGQPVADSAVPSATDPRDLLAAVGEALSQFLADDGGEASPTNLERFAFGLKDDDLKSIEGGPCMGQDDRWEILDALPQVTMVPGDVRRCMKLLLSGFRPLAAEPYFIVVKPSQAGAAIEISFPSREHLGATLELQAAVASLHGLPPGRPGLAVVLLHLVSRILTQRGASVRIVRGEGEQITLNLEFPRTEAGASHG